MIAQSPLVNLPVIFVGAHFAEAKALAQAHPFGSESVCDDAVYLNSIMAHFKHLVDERFI
jgi:hypothetical protein